MYLKRIICTACFYGLLASMGAVYADTIVNDDLVLRSGGKLYFPDGSFQDKAQVQGPAGPQGSVGPASNLTIGNVTTGAPGTAAGANITGTAPNQVLNLLIPQGPQGVKGDTGSQGPVAQITLSAICAAITAGGAQLPSFANQ